jgi:predicted dehydrogenase
VRSRDCSPLAQSTPALVQATRECHLRESFIRDRPWFLRADEAGGGILLAGGIHDVAKLRMMLGDIVRLHAMRAPQRFAELACEDTAAMLLRFESGAVGTLVESFMMLDAATASGDEVHRLRIDGEEGSIEVAGPERIRLTTADGTREIAIAAIDTFEAEADEFLDCIATRREPETSARRQRRNLELVEAAYASLERDCPVDTRPGGAVA